ncbi:alpha/beta hydrolase [Roseiflexus sp.]|uniref:alpha/beta hydrolase n=1 Tax=Roseiflexus sp. TaxID=2562120 RepID=UPI0021DBD777|nr:alpha/beta hydrolase [Roseiflexus sp.]GIV98808.1 MAG: alpha/beta hydrolase [Roseiflexus sp.]
MEQRKTLRLRLGKGLIVALVIGAALVYAAYTRDMRAAEARVAAGRRLVEATCGAVEYGEQGNGFPVLVLHGAGGGYDQGLLIGELFLGEGYRIIAPSRFGYLGAEIPADSSVEAQADAYACLLNTLGVERVVVLGFSAGGPSALQFALRHPQRTQALIMASAISYTEPLSDQDRRRLESGINRIIGSDFFYWAMENVAPGEFLALIGVSKDFQRTMSKGESNIAALTLELMHPMSRRFPGILLDQTRYIPRDWPLDNISAPTFVVHARDDTLVPYSHGEHSATEIPEAEMLPFETGGHLLLGQTDEIRSSLAAFLQAKGVR